MGNAAIQKIRQAVAEFGWKKTLAVVLSTIFGTQSILPWLRNRFVLKMPPGPIPAPLIGTFYVLSPPLEQPGLHEDFINLSKKYGPIFTLYLGSIRGVVLTSKELFYEALKEKQDETAQRPNLSSFKALTEFQGVAMNNGPRWRMIRVMMQKYVTSKQRGVESEPEMMEEIESTLHWLNVQVQEGKASQWNVRQACRRESLNLAMRKIFGFRFGEDSTPMYHETQDQIRVIFEHLAQASPADFMPLFKYFPNPEEDKFKETSKQMNKMIEKELKRHYEEFESKPEDRYDFLDWMIFAKKDDEKNNRETVTDVDMRVCAWDMMAGAIDTSATTMEWTLLTLAKYPEVQRKVHEELDRVVGPNRLPCLDDTDDLEYCMAVIDEMFRWKHFAPQGLPHEAAQDLTLGGYNIPKGTQIFLNFHSPHMNEDDWVEPRKFRPERFLEEERSLLRTCLDPETFFSKPEAYKFVPFGQGRRRCVGYGIGRVMMWLKFLAWMHCFEFRAVGEVDVDYAELGITLVPHEHQLKAVPRPAARLARSIFNDPRFDQR